MAGLDGCCGGGGGVRFHLSLVPADGPLSPTGALTTVLRLVPLFWYVPAAVVMLRRPGRPPRTAG